MPSLKRKLDDLRRTGKAKGQKKNIIWTSKWFC